ncbi:MAG: hypothetical protein IJS28_07585 [Synergistaceae bacterium]|nr:hypothetical protein [Synergistaceae bacterium]
MYAITFSNGKTLTQCGVNGSAFETRESVSKGEVLGGLRRVVIRQVEKTEGEPETLGGEYENMTLGYFMKHGEVTQLVLNEADLEEQKFMQLRADIDYLAMVAGEEL